MHANPKAEPSGELPLDGECRANRTSCRLERSKHRVACRVDDAPAMRFNVPVEYTPGGVQRREGGAIVFGH